MIKLEETLIGLSEEGRSRIDRRTFLKDCAVGAAGFVLSNEALAIRTGIYPKLEEEPFGFGIYPNVRSGFKGVYREDEQTIEEWARNPYISGTQLNFLWGELEPEEGRFRWDMIEEGLEVWARYGKKCWLEIPTAGRWARAGQHPTPRWAYQKGVPKIEATGTGAYPVFWNPLYLELWGNFVRELAKRHDGDPRIDHVSTAGYSNGTEPRLASKENDLLMDQWEAAGFDGFGVDGIYYTQAIKPVMKLFDDVFKKTPVSQTIIDRYEYDPDLHRYAAEMGFILTSNGMGTNSMNPQSRQKWRVRRELLDTKVGYHEWGPSGRNLAGYNELGKVPLMYAYRNIIGDDDDPAIKPYSRISYVPFSKRIPEVETEAEWMAALEWAWKHLERSHWSPVQR